MKKGFTLIELLAVIVILGIIAVITTPLIMGVIEDARKNSAIQSVNGLLEAGEQYQIESMLEGDMTSNINLTSDILDIKGSKPESGTLLIDTEGNMSIIAKYGNYCIEKKFLDEKPSIIESEECEIAQSELEAMDILKTPTFGEKTVSDKEVTLTYTTEEEKNKIHETVCYYGKTESSMSNKVVADDTNCKLPVEAGYAKVCHVSYSGMESCSDVKKLADYFILDGKMLVNFTTTSEAGTITQNDGYITFSASENDVKRQVIYPVDAIDLSKYAHFYVDVDATEKLSSDGSNANFSIRISATNDINDAPNQTLILINDIIVLLQDPKEASIERTTFTNTLQNIDFHDYTKGYLMLGRNSSRATLTVNIYNIWFQLAE